jgi:uncharacterized membrane protein
MSTIVKTIELDVPVRIAYDQWTQFEEFPRFMKGVTSVKQLDDKALHWTASIGGVERSWRAEITEQDPDRRIAWRSSEGARNDGVVTFEPIGDARSRISLQLDVEPSDPVEAVGDAIGVVKRQAEGDLERFKEYIETRRTPSGAWRGEVHDGEVHQDQVGDDRVGDDRVRDPAQRR